MSAYPLLPGFSRPASPAAGPQHASSERTSLDSACDGDVPSFDEKSGSRSAIHRFFQGIFRLLHLRRPWEGALPSYMIALLPSFIGERLTDPSPVRTMANVAVLDGLRGFACLFVFNNHYSNNFSMAPLDSYNGEDRALFVQLPFIRLAWAGSFMVAIFFVISGYVLSVKPLEQIRTRKPNQQILNTLSSSILRRGLRLYLPSLADLFIGLVLVRLGAFDYAWEVLREGKALISIEYPPLHFATLGEQLVDWWKEMTLMFIPFWDPFPKPGYDVHLWTIAYEFGCSMVLFLLQCGVARLRNTPRHLVVIGMILWCFFNDVEILLLFFAGFLLADLDLAFQARNDPLSPNRMSRSQLAFSAISRRFGLLRTKNKRWLLLFLLGLYLGGFPEFNYDSPSQPPIFGYHFVYAHLTPPVSIYRKPWFFHHSIGAVCVVWAATRSSFSCSPSSTHPLTTSTGTRSNAIDLSRPIYTLLTNPLARYLGRISYALYIVHGFVLRSLLYSIMPSVWALVWRMGGQNKSLGESDGNNDVGDTDPATLRPETMLGFVCGIAIATVVVVPATFWVADVFWRVVDEPSMRLARWVEGRACREETRGEGRRAL